MKNKERQRAAKAPRSKENDAESMRTLLDGLDALALQPDEDPEERAFEFAMRQCPSEPLWRH